MMKILAPIDFSDVTENVVMTAAELANALDATVVLMHALHFPYDVSGYIFEGGYVPTYPTPDSLEVDRKNQREELDRWTQTLQSQGLKVESVTLSGASGSEILKEIELLGGDYVVVGSHRHGPMYHLLLGGIGEDVVRKASCPVVVVHNGDDRQEERAAG